jgi:hypothetical protein
MIYRNGTPYKIPPGDIKKLLTELGLSFPINLKYVKELVTYDYDNETEVMPAGVHIPCVANKLSDTGVDQYRYATSVRKNQKNQDVFSPVSETVNKNRLLTEKDSEFVYFLYHFSPFLKSGANAGARPTVEFEMIEKESAKANSFGRVKAKVESLIYELDDIEVLRNIAYTYQFSNVSNMGVETLQNRIIAFVSKTNEITAYERLLAIVENPDNYEDQKLIGLAFENKIIVADKPKRMWFWVGPEGNREGAITTARSKDMSEKGFYNQLRNDRSMLKQVTENIKMQLEAK